MDNDDTSPLGYYYRGCCQIFDFFGEIGIYRLLQTKRSKDRKKKNKKLGIRGDPESIYILPDVVKKPVLNFFGKSTTCPKLSETMRDFV